jgi:hypothetical protein
MEDVADAQGIDSSEMKCLYPFSMFVTKDSDSTFEGVKTNHTEYSAIGKNDVYIKGFSDLLTDSGVEGFDYKNLPNKSAYTKFFNKTDNMTVFMNLVDYLDGDNKPGGTDQSESDYGYQSPCVEAFPMINEVSMTPSLSKVKITSAGNYTATYSITDFYVELYYPFISPLISEVYKDKQLTLEFLFTLPEVQDGIDIMPIAADIKDSSLIDKVCLPVAGVRTVSFKKELGLNYNANGFQPVNISKLFKVTVSSPTNNAVPIHVYLNDINHKYDFNVYLEVKVVDSDGTILDGSPIKPVKGDDDRLVFGRPPQILTGAPAADEFDAVIDYEVNDPRLNYMLDSWTESAVKTDSAANTVATGFLAADEGWGMFVKGYTDVNGVEHAYNLESLGELGFLFTGLPWQTVRLTGSSAERDKIYETMFFEGDLTDSGYANINTEYRDDDDKGEVLKAALSDTPLLPGGSQTISDDQLDKVVDIIQNLTGDGGISPTNLFESATQNEILAALGVDLASGTDIEKEAFYISGYPAFNSRQQLFAIISKGYINQSAQYCMAIVWRDPVADKDGHHPCFIREVTWLENKY